MGKGGYIQLKNKTPYKWTKSKHHSDWMNTWDSNFPGTIEPNSSANIYIEWSVGHNDKKGGEIEYTLEGTEAKFQIQAKAKNGYDIKVVFDHIPVGSREISLGWQHNGTVFFTLIANNSKMNYIASNQSHKNWMENLPDSCSLSQMTIPGTHDACTFGINEGLIKGLPNEVLAMFGPIELITVPIIVDMAKCQNLTLKQQLDQGIRFFDIRLKEDGDKLEAYHGGIRLHMNFSEIVSDCYNFLNTNKKETILLSVKNEGSGKHPINDLVEAEIDKNSKYWCTEQIAESKIIPRTTIPNLGEARQKLVLIRRYSSTKDYGINASDWPDNSPFFEKPINSIGQKIKVQDQYVVHTLFNIHSKWERVEKQLERAANDADSDSLYINFASGSGKGAFPYSISYNGDGVTIKGVNHRMLKYFRSHILEQRYGIVPLDFPEKTENLITALIDSNPFSFYQKTIAKGTESLKENVIYEIRTELNATSCLDVLKYKIDDGASVGIHKINDQKNQQWKLVNAGDDCFYIEPLHASGKVLDVYLDKRENGAKIAINNINHGNNQKWKIVHLNDNLFSISPKSAPDYVLDVPAFNTANGVEIQLYKWKASEKIAEIRNQLWYFYEVKKTYPITNVLEAQH